MSTAVMLLKSAYPKEHIYVPHFKVQKQFQLHIINKNE